MKIYIQVAETMRGRKVKASVDQPLKPLESGGYNSRVLPTVTFAIDVNIDRSLFEDSIATVAEFYLHPDNLITNQPEPTLVQQG